MAAGTAAGVVPVRPTTTTPTGIDRDRDPDGLKILRAEYGTNSNRIDITHRLSQRVIMNRLTARVNNDLAGDDPARDQVKRLWVTYSVEGREMRRDVKEGQVLILP
jgi:hypothetical protein